MKRNKKYYKEIPKGTLMNGLKHIVILLGIGVFSSVLFSQECDDGMVYMEYLNSDSTICVPTTFSTTNQSTLQAFYLVDVITIDGVAIESDDWVGAFNGDVCVGARKWDTSLCGNSVCDLPVFGDDGSEPTEGYMNTGDFPTFKIYDTSEDSYYDVNSEGSPIINSFGCEGVTPECMIWGSNGFYNIDLLDAIQMITGCTDVNACNYDASAMDDDGSCTYAEENYDCEGNCTAEVDCAGECGGSSVVDE